MKHIFNQSSKSFGFWFTWMMGMLIAVPAFAHVKWFNEVEPVKETLENILSPAFLIISLLVAVVIGLLPQIEALMANSRMLRKVEHTLDKYRTYTYILLKWGIAIALLLQITNDSIIAPEIEGTSLQRTLALAVIVLLLIPYHWLSKLAAVLILIIFSISVEHMGAFYMLDYGFYIAIAVALLMEKTKFERFGMPFIYLGTGLSLCWVAVEKWVFPGMSLNIIENWNVPTFGFEPELFLILAAFIEFVVGYLLVVGILNRILAMVVTLIFIMTTTLFGFTEIIGHFLPHVILILFIIEGVSFYHPPIRIHKTKLDQIIFVSLNFLFVLATMLLIYYRFA
ncbi:DoxX family membrane protein [Marinicrinis sediminis]|uniref:DoxX family membrane protein n=1 Tax=Marinicrinis sediminis TaxID=1652465 RepID=A0ABW5R8S9_9BACL